MVPGKHSGTHFDAPHHWITGRDHADGITDSLDLQQIAAPMNVLDFSTDSGDVDFLLTPYHVEAWGATNGEIGAGE